MKITPIKSLNHTNVDIVVCDSNSQHMACFNHDSDEYSYGYKKVTKAIGEKWRWERKGDREMSRYINL